MRDVNTSKNASNNHITNDKTSFFSEQGEIISIQLEIGNDNVEGFSLGGNTNNSQSRKREKAQWDIGRQFQLEWASKFPFIEPITPINEKEASRQVKCIVCSWKLGKAVILQMKLDTIEKHAGKIYVKQTENGEKLLPNGNILRNFDMSNINKNIINT